MSGGQDNVDLYGVLGGCLCRDGNHVCDQSGAGRFVNDRRRYDKSQRDLVVLGKLMAWRLEQSGHECDAELARLWYGALGNLRQEAAK